MKRNRERGLTLIELIVVIVIVGILAAALLAIINPTRRVNEADDAKRKTDIGRIASVLEAYYATNLSYPATISELVPTELKVEPKNTDGASYYYANIPAGCTTDGTGAGKCTAVAVGVLLKAPDNNLTPFYCWRSAGGVSYVAAQANCLP